MEDKGRGGKTALHILAFIGMTLLLLVIACLAAIYIATKGPSETAGANVVRWADGHGLGFAATLFISDEEEKAILSPDSDEPGNVEVTDSPMIIIPDEAPSVTGGEEPETSAEPSPEPSGNASDAPEESPAASGNGEEAAQ